jgi:hypothetical protein
MSNVFKKLTVDCPRTDCALHHLGTSSTCMGWSQTYDRDGNSIGRDPNTLTSAYRCATCGARWQVTDQGGSTFFQRIGAQG